MKKVYIKPQVVEIAFAAEGVIAASKPNIGVNNDGYKITTKVPVKLRPICDNPFTVKYMPFLMRIKPVSCNKGCCSNSSWACRLFRCRCKFILHVKGNG